MADISPQSSPPPDGAQNPVDSTEGESLETQSIPQVGQQSSTSSSIDDAQSGVTNNQPSQFHKRNKLRNLWDKLNIYLLIFVLLMLVSMVIVVALYFKNKTVSTTPKSTIAPQNLSAGTLQQLANNGVQVGDPKQVLNIESNAVFQGQVLVKGELQVAGSIKIGGGNLTIPGLNVGGSATINQLQTQDLTVSGNASVSGQLTVQKGLSVTGSGNFSGPVSTPQLTTGTFQLSGNLIITRHITAGGSIPGRSGGNALGSGGTVSLSGSDTAGSISIHTGGAASAGCFVTINFTQAFSGTPHVVVTPVGSGAAGLSFYINRSTSNFSVCTASPAPDQQSFGFDYIAFE